MFRIEITPAAVDDLRGLRTYDQKAILDAIEDQLLHEPGRMTRNRKKLRPNELAEWELRVKHFRVFYDADEISQEVRIVAVGMKRGNTLYIHGEEFQL